MLNLNFLRALVVILGIAIFSLISLIIFKIMNGDLYSKKGNNIKNQIINTSDIIQKYELLIKRNDTINKIFSADGNIVIQIKNDLGTSFLIIDVDQKIRLVTIKKANDYSFNEVAN